MAGLTKEELKNALVNHGISLPPANTRSASLLLYIYLSLIGDCVIGHTLMLSDSGFLLTVSDSVITSLLLLIGQCCGSVTFWYLRIWIRGSVPLANDPDPVVYRFF
jgi:hypothetical protein